MSADSSFDSQLKTQSAQLPGPWCFVSIQQIRDLSQEHAAVEEAIIYLSGSFFLFLNVFECTMYYQ